MQYQISPKKNETEEYVNNGEYHRFIGWTGSEWIVGSQGGWKGETVDYVRFDETLDVDIYEIIDDEAFHCPHLDTQWS